MSRKRYTLVACLFALCIFGISFLSIQQGISIGKQELPDELPYEMTYSELQAYLKQDAQPIQSLAFEIHHEFNNITLPDYDSRNYCLIIYDDSGNELVHSWLSDVIIAQDSSLEASYFIPAKEDMCILKTSEDLFVSQLSKELFRDMSDEQIDFVLSYLFRNV